MSEYVFDVISGKLSLYLLVAVASIILVVSLIPGMPKSSKMPHIDKIGHGVAYALLAFLLFGVLRIPVRSETWTIILSLLGCVVYGGIIELLQGVTGRSSEFLDLVSDFAGSSAGASLAMLASRRAHG